MRNNKFAFGNLVLFLFCLFILLSCNQTLDKNSSVNPYSDAESKDNQFSLPIISREVAILIARGKISYEYDPTDYDEVVIDKGENWVVGFVFKPKYKKSVGGQPTVIVNKENGNVVDYVFPK